MTLAATVIFGVSLAMILALLTLKRVELKRGARFAENARVIADERALDVKHVILVCEWYIEHTPYFIATFARYCVHVGALSFARLARTSAEHAHALADFVSHKRNFERRETKSEFLKQVSVQRPIPEPVIETEVVPQPVVEPILHVETQSEPVHVPQQTKKRKARRSVASRR